MSHGKRALYAGVPTRLAKWLATLRRFGSSLPAMAPEFDPDRFDDLVLYIAHRTKDDRYFGRTKLAKVLFYADFDAYRDTGQSITGATYVRMPFGPFPRELEDAERRLVARNQAVLDYHVPRGVDKKIIPLTAPPSEIEGVLGIDSFIREMREMNTRQLSDQTHREPGWILAGDLGVEIPYGAAFLPDRPPSRADEAEVTRLARERGTLTDAGWQWERQS